MLWRPLDNDADASSNSFATSYPGKTRGLTDTNHSWQSGADDLPESRREAKQEYPRRTSFAWRFALGFEWLRRPCLVS